MVAEAEELLRWRYKTDDTKSLPQGRALLDAFSTVHDPNMILPDHMNQAMEKTLRDLRQLKIEEEDEEAHERKAKQRERPN